MTKVLYFLVTFLESGLAVFGIRAPLEQPPYRVVSTLSHDVEIRSYGALHVVETGTAGGEGAAFQRLFRYITGANRTKTMIKMTAPVAQTAGARLGQPNDDSATMRFVLPAKLAADPPDPSDPDVKLATEPPRTLAVIRFSGSFDRSNLEEHLATLRKVLAASGRETEGAPIFFGYDPPFTIPFLRRNEVALAVQP